MPYSIPILSIASYHVLFLYPHWRALALGSLNKWSLYDNVNPKGQKASATIKSRLSPRDYEKYERGERCHANALENMPLYYATILAGVMAEHKAGRKLGTDQFCIAWMVLRTIYTAAYLNGDTKERSYIRSSMWFISTCLAFAMLGRSAAWLA